MKIERAMSRICLLVASLMLIAWTSPGGFCATAGVAREDAALISGLVRDLVKEHPDFSEGKIIGEAVRAIGKIKGLKLETVSFFNINIDGTAAEKYLEDTFRYYKDGRGSIVAKAFVDEAVEFFKKGGTAAQFLARLGVKDGLRAEAILVEPMVLMQLRANLSARKAFFLQRAEKVCGN